MPASAVRFVPLALVAMLTVTPCVAQQASVRPNSSAGSSDPLLQGFRNPPNAARPLVWWHWMNGNVTKEGIKLDLEWMKRIGLGGFQAFDASLDTPQIVKQRLVYMTPPWKDAFRFATRLADRLGLEMAIASSPGWSETGGPWVPPSQAMKKVVWSETRVEGGAKNIVLPEPPRTTGPYENIPGGADVLEALGGKAKTPPEFYADSAVIAYRAADCDVPLAFLHPKVTASSGQQVHLAALADGDMMNAQAIVRPPVGETAWVQFQFDKPRTVYAVTLALKGARRIIWYRPDSGQELQASDDGVVFRDIANVPVFGSYVNTIGFPAVTARFFRMTFKTMPEPASQPFASSPPGTAPIQLAELVLHTDPRLNKAEEKAGFYPLADLYSLATEPVPASDAIARADVIDLTSRMHADGTLDWTPPPGRWVVLRFGYSLLGVPNHPASPEATGLEVDKLSATAVKAYFENYLGQYKAAVGRLMGKRGLQYVVTDSWEAGAQNWTDDMIAEFRKRRGYDMRPWMPVLTGRVIESSEASERFLWDFRKTIGELTTEHHYDELGALLHARGMGRYSESHEYGRAFIGDGMDVKKNADVPMGALWATRPYAKDSSDGQVPDIRESASVAHIYGQNIDAAESFTSIGTAWQWSPETLKPTADKELANGLNRFVIHTSVHQPVDDKVPGLTLGAAGQSFTRHETWAESARPWIDYLARSSYLLQQGGFVADVAYFYGEDSNITALFGSRSPPVPSGYNFDYVSADALVNRLSVENGRIVTPTGIRYRVLALDRNAEHMSLPVLRKIRDMVNEGAVVVGPKPVATPSLADDAAEFRQLADEAWRSGGVDAKQSIADALASQQVEADFEYTKPQSDTKLFFVHRRLKDGDLYWVDNRSDRVERLEATFRVTGKAPEFWYPDTGGVSTAPYRIAGGRTTVPLHLDPYQALFVVFRKAATAQSRVIPEMAEQQLAIVQGPWDVRFQPGRGAPEELTFQTLASWSESKDAGVKYFSGTAAYGKIIQAPAAWFRRAGHIWLDLGDVKNIADVTVNGKHLGIVWKRPFRVDVTSALRRGANDLSIKVTNLWVNRLIGDQQPDARKKYTYTTMAFYGADSPLLPSGMLGPVRLLRETRPPR
jgi:hypothetical protein